MVFGEILTGVVISLAVIVISAVVGFMLTRPRLINPIERQNFLDIGILEKGDVTYNSTSGLWGISYHAAMRGGGKIAPYTFVYVTLENKPYISKNSTAKGVSAEVKCTGSESNKKIPPYFARPMDTPAPGNSPNYGSYQASRVDIPPGKPLRGFYIAFCDPGEEKFYGFSESSYTSSTSRQGETRIYFDWKNPQLEMGGEHYDVVVTFSGENFKSFDFRFHLPQRTKDVETG